jgi:spore coat polysaccharide biosynthesis protein SpsF
MNEKMACIIQARMGSTRLPKKIFKNLDDTFTVLDYVLNQITSSQLIDKKIIATTILDEDNDIENYAKESKIDCFRGSSEDVLDRYYQCAKKFSISTIIRITADCPLIDPQIIDQVIETFQLNSYDYVSNTQPITFPVGIAVEIFSFNALKDAWKNAKLPSEREHVTPYLYNNKEKFSTYNIKSLKDYSFIRLTIDKINDLKYIKLIISKIENRPILLDDVLKFTSENPDAVKINNETLPLEGYLKSLKKDKEFFKTSLKDN